MSYVSQLVIFFFIAFGMVVGGSFLGGLGAMLTTHRPPMVFMLELCTRLKIWAMVAAVGGSMDALKIISDGVWYRQLNPVAKQLTYLFVAYLGCQIGALLIQWLAQSEWQGP